MTLAPKATVTAETVVDLVETIYDDLETARSNTRTWRHKMRQYSGAGTAAHAYNSARIEYLKWQAVVVQLTSLVNIIERGGE